MSHCTTCNGSGYGVGRGKYPCPMCEGTGVSNQFTGKKTPALSLVSENKEPFYKVFSSMMTNKGFQIEIWNYMFGQFRIQLQRPPSVGPSPDIVRECCTYSFPKAMSLIAQLAFEEDPAAYLETLATPENCEYKGGRIRLDNPTLSK